MSYTLSTVYREFLPYCMQQMADKRWIILNKHYKPLGQLSSEYVDYEKHPSTCKIVLSPNMRAKLDIKGGKMPTPNACTFPSHVGLLDCFWLYFDERDLKPGGSYWPKLALLAGLKIRSA